MGRYTVSGSGADCKSVVFDSGSSTLSLPTRWASHWPKHPRGLEQRGKTKTPRCYQVSTTSREATPRAQVLEVVAPYGNRGVGKDKACECAETRKTSFMLGQASWQTTGLKLLVSLVQVQHRAPICTSDTYTARPRPWTDNTDMKKRFVPYHARAVRARNMYIPLLHSTYKQNL